MSPLFKQFNKKMGPGEGIDGSALFFGGQPKERMIEGIDRFNAHWRNLYIVQLLDLCAQAEKRRNREWRNR